MGSIDIGSHMALIRLESGKFIALDTVDLRCRAMRDDVKCPRGGVKEDIDLLTNNGENLEAVFATHPYHTLFFEPFYKAYPNAKYYGTPRHLRRMPDIEWAGDVSNCDVLKLYNPQVEMRILPSCCCEFNNPLPPASNHFSNVFVFHKASKVLFNDDTFCYLYKPWQTMGILVGLLGARHDTLLFHHSMYSVALRNTEEAYITFEHWLDKILEDWDMDILCSAHNGILRSGARTRMKQLLDKERPRLQKLAKVAATNPPKGNNVEGENLIMSGAWSPDLINVECG